MSENSNERHASSRLTYYVALVMELATREATCAGITPHPDSRWMEQIGRDLTDVVTGFLCGKRFLVVDRDALYASGFMRLIEQAGIQPVRIPPSAPTHCLLLYYVFILYYAPEALSA